MLVHIGSLLIFAIVAMAIPALGIALILRGEPSLRFKREPDADGARRRIQSLGRALLCLQPQHYWYAVIILAVQLASPLLYAWAIASGQLGLFATAEISIFVVILLAGLGYAGRANVRANERLPGGGGS